MAKSVLELAVGTGQWDAGLKKAKNALDNFTQANGGLQSALNKDSESMQKFVRMMGQMDSTAKTAKGQMNDYKSTIEQLTMQYNRMTDAQRASVGPTYLQAIDQIKQKYQGVADEVAKINQSLKTMPEPTAATGGGGLFGGGKLDGMLQVFGGNLMTKGAGALAGLASEMGDMIKQGIELAKQGEGIRIAFQRLGRGDILDGLREATHGTVTDLELMKAAVKFNDFKLPIDELGTMLAFAQQKAKDTGQSVDYMVESIVNGLGRKSLLILDNLGLSATEIRDKMKDTGDMTKAVGEIIREQMAKAGDYVETAADRATQANVELKNAMTRLGETFQPLTGAANSMWNDIKVGALDLLNNAVRPLIQALAEAGTLGAGARAASGYNNLGGGSKVDRMIGRLGNGKTAGAYSIYQKQLEEFDKYINNKRFQIAAFGGDNSGIAQSAKQRLQTELDGALKMRAEYVKRAQELHNKVPSPYEPAKTSGGATAGTGGARGTNGFDLGKIAFDINKAGAAAAHGVDTMPSVWAMLGDKGLRQMLGIGAPAFDLGRDIREKDYKKLPGYDKNKDRDEKKLTEQMSKLTSGISSITGGIKAMGIELPKEVEKVIGVIQGVMSVIEGVNTVISVFGNTAMTANTAALIANTTALYAATATNLIPGLARGGIVPHAAGGYLIPGNNYSGDNVFAGGAWVNSGELVLSKAQQGNLASQLQGGGLQNLHLTATVHAEQIRLALDNNGQRTGRGELVTWKR